MMNKKDHRILDRYRSTFFLLGMVMSLSAINVLFGWTTDKKPMADYTLIEAGIDIEVPIVRTMMEKKKNVPPPIIKEIVNPIKEDMSPEWTDPDEDVGMDLTGDTSSITNDVGLSGNTNMVIEKVPSPLPIKHNEDKVFIVAERMPQYGTCDKAKDEEERKLCTYENIFRFLSSNLKYPTLARENEIEGTVVVRFVIDKEGTMTDVKIIRDIGGGCGNSVLNALNKMDRWKAGLQRGQPVKVQYSIPVKFSLR